MSQIRGSKKVEAVQDFPTGIVIHPFTYLAEDAIDDNAFKREQRKQKGAIIRNKFDTSFEGSQETMTWDMHQRNRGKTKAQRSLSADMQFCRLSLTSY